MASDKETMMSNANHYIGIVASAKNACGDAMVELVTPRNEVSRYWKGEAGTAMEQALEDTRMEIYRIWLKLSELENQMNLHVQSIYNSWPEEDVAES